MEMYLAGVPVYTIMLISRWLSGAFLYYIRKQVEQLLWHVAEHMLMFRLFWTILKIAPQVVLIKDPLGSATTVTMPRQDRILEAACLDRCNCHLFPVSANQLMTRGKSMKDASSSRSLKGSGEGRTELKIQFQTRLSLCTSCAHFSNCVLERCVWL
jgi:hypothetical protein